VGLGPVAALLVHVFFRAEELAERRRAHIADHARLKVEEDRAGMYLSPLVVKHVDAFELRVDNTAVFAAAADAVLVASRCFTSEAI
jgi:hypothetical protein